MLLSLFYNNLCNVSWHIVRHFCAFELHSQLRYLSLAPLIRPRSVIIFTEFEISIRYNFTSQTIRFCPPGSDKLTINRVANI